MNNSDKQIFSELCKWIQNKLIRGKHNDWAQNVKSVDESIIVFSDFSIAKFCLKGTAW